MNILTSIRTVLRKYADFSGVAPRPEFWWFVLGSAIAHAALNSLNIFSEQGTLYLGASLSGALGVVLLVPTIAVTVRRLRDSGRSWAELFWLLLPVAGLIVLIVHLAEPTRRPIPAPTLTDAPVAASTR